MDIKSLSGSEHKELKMKMKRAKKRDAEEELKIKKNCQAKDKATGKNDGQKHTPPHVLFFSNGQTHRHPLRKTPRLDYT